MTELLCEWVNESLGLDPPTGPRSLELDVTSGYLLGCLLERYNQLDPASANKLKDKRDSDAHVSNYCAIEPTMRALKIKFDAQVASALMGAKPGAASRVLYQLKMALDRIENFTAPVSVFAEASRGARRRRFRTTRTRARTSLRARTARTCARCRAT